jgi:hypothetical protein
VVAPVARVGRSAPALFGEYLDAKGVADPAVADLFSELYEEVSP